MDRRKGLQSRMDGGPARVHRLALRPGVAGSEMADYDDLRAKPKIGAGWFLAEAPVAFPRYVWIRMGGKGVRSLWMAGAHDKFLLSTLVRWRTLT
jgi:hypothetical protein